MNALIGTTNGTGPDSASRREALRRLGSGAALAALAALAPVVPDRRVLPHEATPEAGERVVGQYTVVRVRKVKPDRSGEELTAKVEADFVPQLEALRGFVSYVVLWKAESRDWITIGTFTDKAAADESTSLAATFGRSSGTHDFVEGDPIVVEGEVALASATGA